MTTIWSHQRGLVLICNPAYASILLWFVLMCIHTETHRHELTLQEHEGVYLTQSLAPATPAPSFPSQRARGSRRAGTRHRPAASPPPHTSATSSSPSSFFSRGSATLTWQKVNVQNYAYLCISAGMKNIIDEEVLITKRSHRQYYKSQSLVLRS